MSNPSADEVISMVSSIMTVDSVHNEDGVIRIAISDRDFEDKFVRLVRMLDGTDIICNVESRAGHINILVRRIETKPQGWFFSSSWIPRALFGVVIAFVMIDGFYKAQSTNNAAYIGDPIIVAGIYTAALLGILGTHELGHLAASWHYRLKTTWPYFIPGLPVIGIPTFGAFIRAQGVTVNRKILFDVAIAGPIAGLCVAIIVMIVGAYTAPVLSLEDAASLELQTWKLGQPLFMYVALDFFGKADDGYTVIVTPLIFAAWVGFFITFLNMLPAWQLDGGHMARVLLGKKAHRYATYASVGVLAILGYYPMAIFILVLASRNPGAEPLDDVTPLPTNRKIAYGAMVVLAILCAPLPAQLLP